jgi:hypothetical protein
MRKLKGILVRISRRNAKFFHEVSPVVNKFSIAQIKLLLKITEFKTFSMCSFNTFKVICK